MTRYIKLAVVVSSLAVFFCLLVVNGFVSSDFKADGTSAHGDQTNVPKEILTGGPIFVHDGKATRSVRVPDKTVVLSFDDGPHPALTAQLLEVLKQNDVRATFFVVGSNVARNASVVEQIRENGHEIGLHTFSHADLSAQSQQRTKMEMTEAQLALAGAAEITTSLFRPPYSTSPAALDNDSWRVTEDMTKRGYVVALSSMDSQDWFTSDIDRIVKNSSASWNATGIVTLHDEPQTIVALTKLIPALKDRGYQFATVSQILGQNSAQAAATSDVTRGRVLIAAVTIAGFVANGLTALLFVCGILVAARMLIMLVVARKHAKQRQNRNWSWGPPITEPVSVIVPAYNEGPCIGDTVRSLLASDHPIEIIVVDDGSTDGTADIAEAIGAPNVRVVRKTNGGKASALNTGIAHARFDLVVMMDGDTVFEPETVRRLVQPFADPTVGAVAGNAKVANRRSIVGGWQHIEYVVGFNIDRRVYDVWQSMPTIAGAVGAFRRRVLLDVGGLSNATLAEDTDLTMSICRAGWRIVYEDSAHALTEAPATLHQLWLQRYRWSYGTMQSMWKHRHAVIERGSSGRFGRRGLVMLTLFQVLLPLTSPLVDVFFIYGLVFVDPLRTGLAWLAMLAIQTLIAAFAFRLDRERMRALWLLPLQQFVWRQLMYFVLFQSMLSAIGGIRLGWHKLGRTGGLADLLDAQRSEKAALMTTPVK